MSKVRLIFPVGISLLENAREFRRKALHAQLRKRQGDPVQIGDELDTLPEVTLTNLHDVVRQLLTGNPKEFSAEVFSLEKLIQDERAVQKAYQEQQLAIRLMGTEGGRFEGEIEAGSLECAEKVRDYICRNWNQAMIEPLVRIQGGVKTKTAFRTALLKFVVQLQSSLTEGDAERTYVVITGGYKGFIPWVSLLTFLYENTYLVYLHEDSQTVQIAPGLSLSWDLRRLDELRTVIRRDRIEVQEYQSLPEAYQYLYDEESGGYQLNALGKLARMFFQDATSRYGVGRSLINKLRRRDENLYTILVERLPFWEHLWIGNQIPETVEHERLHSLRLMEYAYWLFTYFPGLEEAIGPKGLLYLISSLWLHDIGHGALDHNGQPVALMPSLVRRYHNSASAAMIRGQGGLPEEALLPREYREPVALLAEYNRKHLALTRAQKNERDSRGQPKYDQRSSLEEVLERASFQGEAQTLLIVGGLLGLLDSLDVQMDRAVSEEYAKAREARNRMEIEYCLRQLQRAEGSLSPSDLGGVQNASLSESLDGLYKRYKEDEWRQKTFNGVLDKGIERTERLCEEALRSNNPVLLQVASYANQALFKMRQRDHFEKHASVGLVYLTAREGTLEVNLRPGEDYEAYTTYIQGIADDIYVESARALGIGQIKNHINQVVVYKFEKVGEWLERRQVCPTSG